MYYTVAVQDIYCSTRTSKTAAWANERAFAPANNLGAVEHSPTPHANGNIMVFASTKSGGAGRSSPGIPVLIIENHEFEMGGLLLEGRGHGFSSSFFRAASTFPLGMELAGVKSRAFIKSVIALTV